MAAHNLSDLLRSTAERFPSKVAVVDPTGETLTYDELNRRSDRLGAFLAARGIGRGDRVGVILPKCTAAVVSLFGVIKSGAAYVPIDFHAPRERTRHIFADAQLHGVIVDERALDVIPNGQQIDGSLAAVVACEAPPSSTVHGVTALEPTIGPIERDISRLGSRITLLQDALSANEGPLPTGTRTDDVAYIIYTSGSTGVPKGAMITHGNALSFIDWCSSALAPSEDDRFSSHTPFHFDASVQDIYPAIKHGASLHLISDELGKNPKELARFICDQRITIWTSTPSALIMLLQFGDLDTHKALSLRIVAFGGEVFPVKHLRELKRRWPSPTYYNEYGPTETTTTCTFAKIPTVIPDDRESPYPIGFPCAHCRAVVLDETGQELSAGDEGLLHISGPSVFAGYWNRPAENATAFVDRNGIKWYNTGDVVRWNSAEGFTYVGRKDGMVKRRGFRIELGEIERALYLHPLIREAAVVALRDEDAGVKIVAFLSCHRDHTPSIVELKAFCATKLPTYMSPDRFVFQDQLPRTSSDKVDYQTLKGELAGSRVG